MRVALATAKMPAVRKLAHRAIEAAVAVFNRNPWTTQALSLIPRSAESVYDRDGVRTSHNHSFIDAPSFQRAYRRAVQAAGWDYEIEWRVPVGRRHRTADSRGLRGMRHRSWIHGFGNLRAPRLE